jgi:hypothetical protein
VFFCSFVLPCSLFLSKFFIKSAARARAALPLKVRVASSSFVSVLIGINQQQAALTSAVPAVMGRL